MELRRDLDYALGALLIGGVVLALVTIGLFSRMTPAIERIRKDNVVTLEAAHDLLGVFVTRAGESLEITDREKVEVALAKMRNNLTVEGEGRLVDAVTDAVLAAQSGDRMALLQLASAVGGLVDANGVAMSEADEEAQRLGAAGAWTASVGGVVLVLIGVFARSRLRRRIIHPVEEMVRVLEAKGAGDDRARCRQMAAAHELERTLGAVNRLLDTGHVPAPPDFDDKTRKKGRPRKVVRPDLPVPATLHAVALHGLLATRAGPWVVFTTNHGVVAANDEGFERLAREDGTELVEQLRQGRAALAERASLGEGLVLAKLA